MDLNWCVICDQHVEEAVSTLIVSRDYDGIRLINHVPSQLESSLYCSESCKMKDQKNATTFNLSSSPSSTLNLNTASRLMKTPALISRLAKKPAAAAPSTTSYPWVPMYRKRHGIAVARRCTPSTSSTLVTKPFAPLVI